MSAIITLILSLLPMLGAWLESWLKGFLESTAATMPAAFPAQSDAVASYTLLTAAYGQLWWFQFAKRNLLWQAIASVPPAIAAGVMPAADAALLKTLAAKVG